MKTIKIILSIATAVTLMATSVFGAGLKKDIKVEMNAVNVVVNGEKINTDTLNYNKTTYLPLRVISESIGMEVNYDAKSGVVALKSNGTKSKSGKNAGVSRGKAASKNLTVEMGSLVITVNGQKVDGQSLVYNGVTYLPLRKVAEAIGAEVKFDNATQTAYLTTVVKGGEITSSSAVKVVEEIKTETKTETKTEDNKNSAKKIVDNETNKNSNKSKGKK